MRKQTKTELAEKVQAIVKNADHHGKPVLLLTRLVDRILRNDGVQATNSSFHFEDGPHKMIVNKYERMGKVVGFKIKRRGRVVETWTRKVSKFDL